MIVQAIIQLHRAWDGLKSVEQYKREQRSEAPSLFLEGVDELLCIVKWEPAREMYLKPSWKEFITPLEPITDSRTWAEDARELIRLSCSSYVFDSVSKRHDEPGYWVGTNLDTRNSQILTSYSILIHASTTSIIKTIIYTLHSISEGKPLFQIL